MSKPGRNDISIGKDRWILFGDLNEGYSHATEVGIYLSDVMPFFDELETECVAECCGVQAFNLWQDNIERAAGKLDGPAVIGIVDAFKAAENVIESLPSDVIDCARMNQHLRKHVFLQLLTHVRSELERIAAVKNLTNGDNP